MDMLGATLLHYRIIRKLGQGGMGEVYLAEDTRLKRQVAMKVLPEAVRHDPERLRRFRTEAEAAAKLNHPNIATIYAIEEATDLLFITMEHVDGQPLWAHIPPDGLPLDQFFTWVLPLSDALAHAHEHGVTHRDLKPGNIMIRVDGVPKILDFGLARITRPETEVDPVVLDPAAVDSQAPTKIMKPKAAPAPPSLTQGPVLLGTPAYMSPEQAERKVVDHRTDLFSFGVVLYEALTGKRPFEGATLESLIGRILTQEPEPVTVLRPMTPHPLWWTIRKCLQKDRAARLQTARELYTDLQAVQHEVEAGTVLVDARTLPPPPEPAPPAPVPVWRRPVPLTAAILLAVSMALVTWLTVKERVAPSEPPLRKFQIPVEGDAPPGDRQMAAISPDGTMIAYIQGNRLWVRDLDQMESREIPDSEGAAMPFWSPQSDFVGYFVERTLKKVSVQGGSSTVLCRLPSGGEGATWGPGETIVVSQAALGLFEVSAQGGEPRVLIKPDSTQGELSFYSPHLLPDGRTLVFTVRNRDGSEDLVVQAGETRKRLLHSPPAGDISILAYSSTGHLLYSRTDLFITEGRSAIWAVPFSLSTLAVTGEAFPVAPHGTGPSISADGTLMYSSTSEAMTRLVWVDRTGAVGDTLGRPQTGMGLVALSPDGRRVAMSAVEQGNRDIWVHDVERGTATRLTLDPAIDNSPVWSPDGTRIAFASWRSGGGDVYVRPADGTGTETRLYGGPGWQVPSDWSAGGRVLLFWSPETGQGLWSLPLVGVRTPVRLTKTPFNERWPVLSPDGRYMAYQSNETGRWEVYVTAFPSGAGKWPVSVNGGTNPRWNPDGTELFYVEGNRLMAVPVRTAPGFEVAGPPRPLFAADQVTPSLILDITWRNYDVSRDGRRFVMVQEVAARASDRTTITVVQNWVLEFKKQ